MKIIKLPEHLDDSFYFILENEDRLTQPKDVKYLEAKRDAFIYYNTQKFALSDFFDRPSFRGVADQNDLAGTIYTSSAEDKNDMILSRMLSTIRVQKSESRRCVIRLADSFKDYMNPTKNTSCLNIIHYLPGSVRLFFRASDMTNELLYDLYLIKQFFIKPVYQNDPVDIHVIASTAQNIIDPFELILKS